MKLFHRSRSMFAIVSQNYSYVNAYLLEDSNNQLLIAPKHDSRSHSDWLKDVYKIKGSVLRGYYLNKELFVYKTNFNASMNDFEEFLKALPVLVYQWDLNGSTIIYRGVIRGKVGEQWKGKERMGTVKTYMVGRKL